MPKLRRYLAAIDGLSDRTGKVVSWLSLLLVLIVVFDVTRRYAFRRGSIALQELEFHLYAIVFLLGMAYTLLHRGHVRVDVFYTRFSPRGRAILDLVGVVLLFFPFVLVILWRGVDFFQVSYGLQERSTAVGGLPVIYPLKAVLPVAFFLLLLQGITQFLKDLTIALRGKEE